MTRIKIDLPETFHFETTIPVRITDLNYGGHVGNDTFLSIIHEARIRFLNHYGFSELDVDGTGTIMNDAALVYKAQVYYGAALVVRMAVTELSSMSCEIVYLLSDKQTAREVARIKTGIVFFDYKNKQIAKMPDKFRNIFE